MKALITEVLAAIEAGTVLLDRYMMFGRDMQVNFRLPGWDEPTVLLISRFELVDAAMRMDLIKGVDGKKFEVLIRTGGVVESWERFGNFWHLLEDKVPYVLGCMKLHLEGALWTLDGLDGWGASVFTGYPTCMFDDCSTLQRQCILWYWRDECEASEGCLGSRIVPYSVAVVWAFLRGWADEAGIKSLSLDRQVQATWMRRTETLLKRAVRELECVPA